MSTPVSSVRARAAASRAARFADERLSVITLHRPVNVDDPVMLAQLLDVHNAISGELPLVFPDQTRTKPALEAQSVSHQITVVEPNGYLDFLDLMAGSSMVVTDSRGIQEETPVLGVSFLTLRGNTERPITTTEGTNQLVERHPDPIIAWARNALGSEILPRRPALWDGRAGERIAAAVLSAMDDPRRPTDR